MIEALRQLGDLVAALHLHLRREHSGTDDDHGKNRVLRHGWRRGVSVFWNGCLSWSLVSLCKKVGESDQLILERESLRIASCGSVASLQGIVKRKTKGVSRARR